MRRSEGVTISAVVALIFSVFAVLPGAIFLVSYPFFTEIESDTKFSTFSRKLFLSLVRRCDNPFVFWCMGDCYWRWASQAEELGEDFDFDLCGDVVVFFSAFVLAGSGDSNDRRACVQRAV
jgi:hypothetical protein